MVKPPIGYTLYRERDLPIEKLIDLTIPTYKLAFQKGVWQENLSNTEIRKRLIKNYSGDFRGYWLVKDGVLACTSWYQFVDLQYLYTEKGPELAFFAQQVLTNYDTSNLIWHAETITHPNFWHQGLASLLKEMIHQDLKIFAKLNNSCLVLTRMRDDNHNIIAINTDQGMKRTGIRMPCTLDPSKYHEYWYLIVRS